MKAGRSQLTRRLSSGQGLLPDNGTGIIFKSVALRVFWIPLKALIIAGMAGAGKTEFANYCRSLGVHVVQMGELVRERVKQYSLEPTGKNIARVANEERLKHGSDVWARRTVKVVGQKNTVIDGTRSEAEVAYFRGSLGKDAIVVAVYASAGIRYERLRARNRNDVPLTLGEFEERDRRELGWGLGNVIALSDRTIGNEGSMEELKSRIRELLQELNFGK